MEGNEKLENGRPKTCVLGTLNENDSNFTGDTMIFVTCKKSESRINWVVVVRCGDEEERILREMGTEETIVCERVKEGGGV